MVSPSFLMTKLLPLNDSRGNESRMPLSKFLLTAAPDFMRSRMPAGILA